MKDIKFLVNGVSYIISLDKILNFPIKTAFLNLLVDNYLHKKCGVKIVDDAIS